MRNGSFLGRCRKSCHRLGRIAFRVFCRKTCTPAARVRCSIFPSTVCVTWPCSPNDRYPAPRPGLSHSFLVPADLLPRLSCISAHMTPVSGLIPKEVTSATLCCECRKQFGRGWGALDREGLRSCAYWLERAQRSRTLIWIRTLPVVDWRTDMTRKFRSPSQPNGFLGTPGSCWRLSSLLNPCKADSRLFPTSLLWGTSSDTPPGIPAVVTSDSQRWQRTPTVSSTSSTCLWSIRRFPLRLVPASVVVWALLEQLAVPPVPLRIGLHQPSSDTMYHSVSLMTRNSLVISTFATLEWQSYIDTKIRQLRTLAPYSTLTNTRLSTWTWR